MASEDEVCWINVIDQQRSESICVKEVAVDDGLKSLKAS